MFWRATAATRLNPPPTSVRGPVGSISPPRCGSAGTSTARSMRMLPSETTRPHSPTLYLGGLTPGNPSAQRHRNRSTRVLVVCVGSDHGVCPSFRRGLKPSLLTSDGRDYRVEDGTGETGNEPSERILTDPAAREGAREPDRLPRLCTRAEHTEHNRDTPSAETRPVDATTVPIV